MGRSAPDGIARLTAAIRAIADRPASSEEEERFSRYLELLLVWNRTHRLTGVQSREDVVEKLFRDSLLFLPLLPPRPLRLVDIGAGAGIPGVPLRILDPGISLTLIEARRKRVSFLATLRRELGLEDIQVLHGRAETLSQEHTDLQGKFDVAVCRAVGLGPDFLRAAMKYLRRGGVFIASGPPPDKPPASVGHRPAGELRQVDYPSLGLTRRFLVIRKKVDWN